ncbi:hypothetical protein [Halomonas sp. BC04]|uniref:hypothetical protein n=1 Tax=Halomonas sp. BC04 TaxID=1403540 RepID=UPI0003ED744F|nr:hypothetical protein [Halomonas sp. BC04]EWH02533.1 hypothetical protein Q427_08185 [Halomonas sp. BC04]
MTTITSKPAQQLTSREDRVRVTRDNLYACRFTIPHHPDIPCYFNMSFVYMLAHSPERQSPVDFLVESELFDPNNDMESLAGDEDFFTDKSGFVWAEHGIVEEYVEWLQLDIFSDGMAVRSGVLVMTHQSDEARYSHPLSDNTVNERHVIDRLSRIIEQQSLLIAQMTSDQRS